MTADKLNRPFKVSIAFLSFNQATYVAEALRSVLSQDLPGLDIVVSDDCSTDASYEILQQVVGGYRGASLRQAAPQREKSWHYRQCACNDRTDAGRPNLIRCG